MQQLIDRLRFRSRATQYGALPYRCSPGGVEVMLVTSRASGRWIVPKGWLAPGLAPHLSAAKEAYEEAGVVGTAGETPIGTFLHLKTATRQHLRVEVFPMEVVEELDHWPERFQRRRQWFNLDQAAHAVSETSLRRIISSFRPAEAE